MNKNTSPVAVQALVEGAWWALEQSGRLMQAASLLFDSGDASTAFAIAMFGREELGRFTLLLEMAMAAKSGGPLPTVADIRRALDDHTKRQRAGALSVTLTPGRGTPLHAAMLAESRAVPGSQAWHTARQPIDKAVENEFKHRPARRHQDRMKALYVDIDDRGASWSRPACIDLPAARHGIHDV